MQAVNDNARNLDTTMAAQAERLARKAREQEQEEARKKLAERSDDNVKAILEDQPKPVERTLSCELSVKLWSDGQVQFSVPDPIQFADLIKLQIQLLMEHSGKMGALNAMKQMQAKAPRDHFLQRMIAGVRQTLGF